MYFKLISNFLQVARMVSKYTLGLSLILLLVPLALSFLLPFVIFRRIVFHSAPILRKDLGKMVSSLGSLFSVHNPYKVSYTKIVVAGVIEGGSLPEEKLRTALESTIEASHDGIDGNSNSAAGVRLYPELKQSLTWWIGYPFWSKSSENEFAMEDHFFIEKERLTDSSEVNEILRRRTHSPFPLGKPLWNITLYKKYQPNGSEHYYEEGKEYSLIIIEFCWSTKSSTR
jgi:hypothetical protein